MLNIGVNPSVAAMTLLGGSTAAGADSHRPGEQCVQIHRNRLDDGKGAVVVESLAVVVLSFVVTDTRIRTSAKDQARLFNLFEYAEGSTLRRYGGMGLGLVISKRLAEAMGGKWR